jgi:hypothetical protein
LTERTLPSTAVIVPRTRTLVWACAAVMTSTMLAIKATNGRRLIALSPG